MDFSTAPFPLSVAALGCIRHDGQNNDISARVIHRNDTWVVDQTHFFSSLVWDGERIAVKGPGYLQSFGSQTASLPATLFQVNSIGETVGGNKLALHSLINEETRESHLISDLQFESPSREIDSNELEELERRFLAEPAYSASESELIQKESRWGVHPRFTYLQGIQSMRRKEYSQSKAYFHASMLLGHLDGFEAELYATRHQSKIFRDTFPEIFHAIQRGDQLRVLTQLRSLLAEYPLEANATLAYCLRKSREWEEGIQVCQNALAQDPSQADVYGHLWSYLTQLGRDREAFEVAATHLSHYPLNPQAYTDALDSCLLLGEFDLAKWYAFGYLIHTKNLNTGLKNLFKYFEARREFAKLRPYFETILSLLRSPTPETLVYYGETLLELGENVRAMQPLERALMAAPQDPSVVLANGRALAKAGKLHSAIKLMTTVLADRNRRDDTAERFLLIAFLSELYRNSDDLSSALSLWPTREEMDEQLLAAVGPRPFVEYAYCLGERDDLEAAFAVVALLSRHFDGLYIVEQLKADLDTAVI